MNTHSAHEYTMFTPAQLLRNWHEQPTLNNSVSVICLYAFSQYLKLEIPKAHFRLSISTAKSDTQFTESKKFFHSDMMMCPELTGPEYM
jgi:hypothetical protein